MPIMSDALAEAVEEQMGVELFNERQYLQMATVFNNAGFDKLDKYHRDQAADEHGHATLLLDLLLDCGFDVEVPATRPPMICSTAEECADLAVTVEEQTTNQLNVLCSKALGDGNHTVLKHLMALAGEQVEEYDRAIKFRDALNEAGGNLHFMTQWIEK